MPMYLTNDSTRFKIKSRNDFRSHLQLMLDLDLGLNFILPELELMLVELYRLNFCIFFVTDIEGQITNVYSSKLLDTPMLVELYLKTVRFKDEANLGPFFKDARPGDHLCSQSIEGFTESHLYQEYFKGRGHSHFLTTCAVHGDRKFFIFTGKALGQEYDENELREYGDWGRLLSQPKLRWRTGHKAIPIVRMSGEVVFEDGVKLPEGPAAKLLLRLISEPEISVDGPIPKLDRTLLKQGTIQNLWGYFTIVEKRLQVRGVEVEIFTINQLESFESYCFRKLLALGLSHQQVKIVWYLLHGISRKEVSQIMGISENTTNTVLKRLYKKLCVESLGDLFVFILNHDPSA